MAKKLSAGILLYRERDGEIEVFLVHPGGPFWAKKDEGAWSIPKGEYTEGEDPLAVAKREFHEETNSEVRGHCLALRDYTFTLIEVAVLSGKHQRETNRCRYNKRARLQFAKSKEHHAEAGIVQEYISVPEENKYIEQ